MTSKRWQRQRGEPMNEIRSVPLATASDLPPMQPRSVFGILGAAISTYARFPLVLLGIVAPLELPLAIINSVVAALNPIQGLDPSQIYSKTNLINLFLYTFFRIILLLAEVVVSFAILAAITRWLAARYIGIHLSVWQAYKGVAPRLGALLGGMAAVIGAGIVSIVFVVILAVLIALINLQIKEDNGFVPGAGGLPLPLWQLVFISLPPSLLIGYLLMRWSLIVQVVMVEKSSANRALGRSWRLVRGRFWQVAVTLLLAVAPAILLTSVAPLLFPVLSANQTDLLIVIFDLGVYLLRVLLLPFGFTALVLLYLDLRIRKEGYNLSTLAAEMSDTKK